ncbi:unnamed protein product [Adineta steineri]|uniref:SUEL-type lectin domain-containing protein n=1 Tax=Adineta steineri TaxID=433720 RepID=A0A818WYH9_9BILA|nr:unnamed protein product [Adineta steineri]
MKTPELLQRGNGHVCRIQPHVVKLHHHRSRGKLRPSITTKSSSISILHVTIRSQDSTLTTQKQSNNQQNSTQNSKDLIRSVNVYRKVSVSQSFLKNKVEPKKSIDSFTGPIKSDIPPTDDLYKANKNLDQTTLQLKEFSENKLPNSINNDSEINKNYPDFSTITSTTASPEILTSLPENSIINITCVSPTPTINIQYAFYGVYNNTGCSCSPSNCTEMNVTQTVISYCANSSNPSICIFTANNGFFNDTCIGKPKLFSLTYACT